MNSPRPPKSTRPRPNQRPGGEHHAAGGPPPHDSGPVPEASAPPAAAPAEPDGAEPVWRKSSFSAGDTDCVQVAAGQDSILLRESDAPEVALAVAPAVWADFVRGVKSGDFDQ